MEQGREARVCQETAERPRKPESGAATGVDVPVVHGASPGDVVEGAKDLVGAGSGVTPDGLEDVTTLEGIESSCAR